MRLLFTAAVALLVLISVLMHNFIHNANSAVCVIPNESIKAKSGECYSEFYNFDLTNKGEVRKMQKHCMDALCSDDVENRDITCGAVADEPPCELQSNLSKPYPEYCPLPECS